MPIRISSSGTARKDYESPFVGPVDHQAQLGVDVTGLTDKEVDDKGYLKPGVPFTRDGALVGATDVLYGCTMEEVKIAADNAPATLAAITDPVEVAVALSGAINRAVAEDMLERAYTADELAAFETSNITLIF